MKIIPMFLTLCLFCLSLNLSAQFKVAGNGNVGINTPAPAFKLDLNSPESRSYYSNRNALHINHFGQDPRLCSNEKIVFFKPDGSGYANIECQVLLQHLGNTTKDKIETLENKGLFTISKLKGVSFKPVNDATKAKGFGFLVGDVEAVIPEAVFKNDSTHEKSLAYSYIIAFLVEAVKEQSVMIEKLKVEVAAMEKNLQENGQLTNSSSLINIENNHLQARLDQNIPNPFSKQTKIGCFIPENAHASLLFSYSMNGNPVGKYAINGKGEQILTIDGSKLVPGTYFYHLIIDGQEVGSKKMIFTK